MKKKRLALLAVPAILTVALATPAHALGDDGDETTAVEQTYDGMTPAIQTVMAYVHAQLGKPYVAGGRGPDVFDCSGLTSAAYRQIGIIMPAYSFTQARMGWAVSRDDIRPGDLLFFTGGPTGNVRPLGHVAIAVSSTEMISAPHPGARVHRVRIPGGVERVRRFVD
jgi:cell wall-associated NlpC family hydrolase